MLVADIQNIDPSPSSDAGACRRTACMPNHSSRSYHERCSVRPHGWSVACSGSGSPGGRATITKTATAAGPKFDSCLDTSLVDGTIAPRPQTPTNRPILGPFGETIYNQTWGYWSWHACASSPAVLAQDPHGEGRGVVIVSGREWEGCPARTPLPP